MPAALAEVMRRHRNGVVPVIKEDVRILREGIRSNRPYRISVIEDFNLGRAQPCGGFI
jgi:hypothetical protein